MKKIYRKVMSYGLLVIGVFLFVLFITHYSSLITPVQAATDCNLSANANKPECIIGTVKTPGQIKTSGSGEQDISNLINTGVQLLFSVAAVAFVLMVIWSGVSWILSGGDKEAIAKARARITWAVIGIIILSLSFAIIRILEEITGFKFLG